VMEAPKEIYLTEELADEGSFLWSENRITADDHKYILVPKPSVGCGRFTTDKDGLICNCGSTYDGELFLCKHCKNKKLHHE
jgi:hypothetical protein